MKSNFTVCIVGRPNVGKSTLFNKLTHSRRAIVNDMAGVTRDRMFGHADLDGVGAWLIDTGGFEPEAKDAILAQVREQAQMAIEEADVICFTVDGRTGLTSVDMEIARLLRKSGKRVVVAVNKLDSPKIENDMADFFRTGFEAVMPVSAEHSIGLGELVESLAEGRPRDVIEEAEDTFDEEAEEESEKKPEKEKPVTVAVVGCPNVGKSSLVNHILGEKRMTVSEIPGTTRDSVDSLVKRYGRKYLFTDTAGIRRKGRISQKLEKYSIIMALKGIGRSQICLLVIDATRGIRDQDARIAGIIRDEGKACIILVNKWDLVEKDSLSTERFTRELREKLKFLSYAPVLFVSAETGQRVERIFESINVVVDEYRKRVPTGPLNRLIRRWTDRKPPPLRKGKRGKIYYVAQTKAAPPIFSFVVNNPERLPDMYRRYLANRIRDEYRFDGSPVICRFQPRKSAK
jgi:GTP-binding protein